MNDQELEYNVGEDESPATVEVVEEEKNPAARDAAPEKPEKGELDEYGDKVKKRIDKLTARLRETQRREQAALDYAKQVQAHAQQLEDRYQKTDEARLYEAKSRVETQAVALKQIIRKAREEGDLDTETEAQQRLTALTMEQSQISAAEAQRQAYYQQLAAQQAAAAQQSVQQPVQQARQVDPRAEDWAERNSWYGKDNVMTHAAWGIHRQLIQVEGVDPNSDEYYDELDKRIRQAFPQKFGNGGGTLNGGGRTVQTVAPASRASGINSTARRTVKLTPSQVAIAKKLGVPLEEYAKYVKE